MIELATNFFCLNEERKGHRTVSQPTGRDNYNQLGTCFLLPRLVHARASLWSARAHTGCHLCTLGSKSVQHPPPGTKAGELLTGYNWSLVWSLSISGLTVWPGEGAWGGWATGAGRGTGTWRWEQSLPQQLGCQWGPHSPHLEGTCCRQPH